MKKIFTNLNKIFKKETDRKVNGTNIILTLSVFLIVFGMSTYEVVTNEMEKTIAIHTEEIAALKEELGVTKKQEESYNMLYVSSEQELIEEKSISVELKSELEVSNIELNKLREVVKESQQYDANRYSRGSLPTKSLSKYSIVTVDEMNDWIAKRAPEGSPFIGLGAAFLEASRQADLDPKYLVAHAGLESTWGTSAIARDKHNFFGIGAFNHDPYNSAYSFNSFEEGIIEGALWIKRNYTDNGQDSLSGMIYGDPNNTYCVTDGGNPSQHWIDTIVDIIL